MLKDIMKDLGEMFRGVLKPINKWLADKKELDDIYKVELKKRRMINQKVKAQLKAAEELDQIKGLKKKSFMYDETPSLGLDKRLGQIKLFNKEIHAKKQ